MRGFCHGSHSLFLPIGARRPGVAVPHAPVGVAKRLCHCAIDTIATHAATTQAPPRAETRMVKKLMRLGVRSISGAPQAVRDTASGLDALCLG